MLMMEKMMGVMVKMMVIEIGGEMNSNRVTNVHGTVIGTVLFLE